MQSLAQAKAGDDYTIKWMFGAPQILEFLKGYGIREGSDIRVFQQGKDGFRYEPALAGNGTEYKLTEKQAVCREKVSPRTACFPIFSAIHFLLSRDP